MVAGFQQALEGQTVVSQVIVVIPPVDGYGEGEINADDLVGETLVFVEVRVRRSRGHGGAAASITAAKQRRVRLAARHFLQSAASPPPCRFDVVVIDGDDLEWIHAAFTDDG